VAGFAYTYGRRKSEIAAATWDQMAWAGGTARLDPWSTEIREGRVAVLTPDHRRILVRQWDQALGSVLKRNPETTPRDVREVIPWAI
jgi:hypothetical protein